MNGLKFYASTLEVFDDLLLAVLSEVFGFQISTKKINWLSYEASLFVAVQTHEFFKDIEENYSVPNTLILLVLELLFIQYQVCTLNKIRLLSLNIRGSFHVLEIYYLFWLWCESGHVS